jgi:hypothetical protein
MGPQLGLPDDPVIASREAWSKATRCKQCGNVGVVLFSDRSGQRVGDYDTRIESISPAFKALARKDGDFDIWCVKCDVPSLDLLRLF